MAFDPKAPRKQQLHPRSSSEPEADEQLRRVVEYTEYNAGHLHDRHNDVTIAIQKRLDDGWRVYEPLTGFDPMGRFYVWWEKFE